MLLGPDYNQAAYDQGAECRIVYDMEDWVDMMRNNPYSLDKSGEYNPWLDRSFQAGWAEADPGTGTLDYAAKEVGNLSKKPIPCASCGKSSGSSGEPRPNTVYLYLHCGLD